MIRKNDLHAQSHGTNIMTTIYLVRHADAEFDPPRKITETGHQETEKISKYIASHLQIEVDQIIHSGKVRAEQTAQVLGEHLKPAAGIVEGDNLKPNDDLGIWLDRLESIEKDVMIVGHLPFLNNLAYCLITGQASPEDDRFRFRKSSIVCLTKQEKRWILKWMITPDMIRTGVLSE
ncbi:MAG: phosphohistidine phosphatase SixA [Candidatus Thorarchaeota archaeon]|jgi:phosphohistidine phosphatase